MAKSSGTNSKFKKGTGGFKVGDDNFGKGKITGVQDLSTIKNPDVYREVKAAISRYHATTGVRQTKVKLADLDKYGAVGVHVTTAYGRSEGVYLNKRIFNQKKSEIIKGKRDAYKSGFLTTTNKPIAHTVTHELAHATWNTHLTSAKAKAAGKDINKVYKIWASDKTKRGYGTYAKSNVSEFFAETMTKGIHGKSDKYTRRLKSIVKKYKL